ncbi:Histone acetyltransferase complex subunit [Ceratobasidium sp. 414]|nr:Histone acetyltransferase complex subunit [Ceratobasidium sp. 414]
MAPILTLPPMLDEQRSLMLLRLLNTSQHLAHRNVDVSGKGGLLTGMVHMAQVTAVHLQNANREPPVQARQLSPAESLRSFGATAGYSSHHGTNGFYENGYGHHNGVSIYFKLWQHSMFTPYQRHHDDEDGTDDDAVVTTNNHSSSSRSRKPPRRTNNAPVATNNSHTATNPHEDTSSLMDVVIAHPSDDEEHSFRPPEEPLYCTCKRVSFGEMIGCDNDDCPFEWFHLACVGITKPSPMEKWYCDRCREDAARKANAESSVNVNDATIGTSTTNGAKPSRGGRGRGKGAGGVKRGRTVK